MQERPLFRASAVGKSYGKQLGCRDVSFDLYPGEIMGIVGESGSGKSMPALSIRRLLPNNLESFDRGKILFNNQDFNF